MSMKMMTTTMMMMVVRVKTWGLRDQFICQWKQFMQIYKCRYQLCVHCHWINRERKEESGNSEQIGCHQLYECWNKEASNWEMFRTELWFFFFRFLIATQQHSALVRKKKKKALFKCLQKVFFPSKAKYHVDERESLWTVDWTPCCHSIISMLCYFFHFRCCCCRCYCVAAYIICLSLIFFLLSLSLSLALFKMSLSVVMAVALLFNFVCAQYIESKMLLTHKLCWYNFIRKSLT